MSPNSPELRVDLAAGAVIVRPEGLLDLTTYEAFRDDLLRWALTEPAALVVVLDDGFRLATPALASVFGTVATRVAHWPGVPVLLVATTGQHHRALADSGRSHYKQLEAALTAIGTRAPRRSDQTSLPGSTNSAFLARRFVREACHRWHVDHLRDDAVLVASELVENAVEHAHSAPTLRLELTGRRLAIAVRDELSTPPRAREADTPVPGGRGIPLIDDVSLVWGHSPWPSGGKVVWAVLGEA
jgi:anti-sigma regulatory factor (Ser/Thr protein kinase)